MPNLHDIERRINSVSSTKQITRTMQMVAAAKVRHATERVKDSEAYANSMIEMLTNVAQRAGSSASSLLRSHDEVKNALLVVVVSDRGLAGGFNTTVLRHADQLMRRLRSQGTSVQVVACGKKAASYYSYRKIDPLLSFSHLSADPTVEEAASVAALVIDGYVKERFDEIVLIYNHAKNAAEQNLCEEQVFPLDVEKFTAEITADKGEGATSEQEATLEADVIFEPSPEVVLDLLVPAYVRTTIYHALIDSAAAEQSARRSAMMSATDNATDMVETLTRLYNRVRQGAITTEISEIVGGAAALED